MTASSSFLSVHPDTPNRPYLSNNGSLARYPVGRTGGFGLVFRRKLLSTREGRRSWVKSRVKRGESLAERGLIAGNWN